MVKQDFFSYISDKLGSPADLKQRQLIVGGKTLVLIYLADLVDDIKIYDSVVAPLMAYEGKLVDYSKTLTKKVLCTTEVIVIQSDDAVEKILKAQVILTCPDGTVISIDCEKVAGRVVAEPPTSSVIKGPREGFVENYKMNLVLIRRRLPTEKLKMKNLQIGTLTKTEVIVMYIEGIANAEIVDKIMAKLENVNIDGVIDSSYLAGYLSPRKKSIFRQVGNTEKPDVLVSKMLEGRVGIVVDGSPIVLTLPFLIIEDLQNSDDYYQTKTHASFVRIIRLIGIITAMLLPAIYLSLLTYHYKIIPLEFLISILNTTNGIPFAPMAEILFIIILFEILYDASLRMPRYLGLALSIVGALILGETAVSAGLVSPPAVMIVALSGLTFYTVPDQAAQLSELRLIFVIIGGVLGLYGVLVGVFYLVVELCDMDSYGGAYLAPIAPYIKADMKDFLGKKDITKMSRRPYSVNQSSKNRRRMSNEKD